MGWARQVEHVRLQAGACAALGSPMYADLAHRIADDLLADGPVATVLAGHEDDSGPSALTLRLLGSVHRLVLERRAGALAAYYPSVGGRWQAEEGWREFRRLLAEEPTAVREWLDRPPQTNEVGRAAALYGGLCHLAAEHPLPVRLFELGASGGLNLLADRFAYQVGDRRWGETDSPVRLAEAWAGRLPPETAPRVLERTGCDVRPVDVSTTQGRLTLTAYVWPDQEHRLARLRGAFAVADQTPLTVHRRPARDLVGGLDLDEGTTTVVWHSVMWQYLDPGEQAAVTAALAALGERATTTRPLAHLFLEPTRRTPQSEHEFLVVLQTWPDGDRRVLGSSVGHGLPTTWE